MKLENKFSFYADMAPLRYTDCFDYIIRLSKLCGHPPFCPSTKFNIYYSRIEILINCTLFFRMIMTVIMGNRGMFISLALAIALTDTFIKIFQINIRYEDYKSHFNEIDLFLSETEFNRVTSKKNIFLNIWKKERPEKLVMAHLIVTVIVTIIWSFNTVYNAAVNSEEYQPLYWSPYLELSPVVKWLYISLELIQSFPFTLFPWNLSATFTSLVKFQHARFMYVRQLALLMFEKGFEKQKKEDIIWWVKIHQQVLRSAYTLNDLLGLHALSSYFELTLCAVLAVIILLFENVTEDKGQKFISVIVTFLLVAQFGYNCIIFDKWEEEEQLIRDIIFTDGLMKATKWQFSAYKMCMTRLNKPLEFSGLSFVTMDSKACRGMVTNIYSLYTSMMSILSHRAP